MKIIETPLGKFEKNELRYNIRGEEGDTEHTRIWAEQNGYIIIPHEDIRMERAIIKKKAEIAAARYNTEMGGFTLPPEQGNLFVRTDARNRTLLNAAALRAVADPTYEVLDWKTNDGTFITLSNEMILILNEQVAKFIRECFAKEHVLNDTIDSAETAGDVKAISW